MRLLLLFVLFVLTLGVGSAQVSPQRWRLNSDGSLSPVGDRAVAVSELTVGSASNPTRINFRAGSCPTTATSGYDATLCYESGQLCQVTSGGVSTCGLGGSGGSTTSYPLRTKISGATRDSTTDGSVDTYTIPAGTMAVGDILRIKAYWTHTGGTTLNPRINTKIGGSAIHAQLAPVASETALRLDAEVMIVASGTSAQNASTNWYRLAAGSFGGAVAGAPSFDPAASQVVDFRCNWQTGSGETLTLVWFSVELVKSANIQ